MKTVLYACGSPISPKNKHLFKANDRSITKNVKYAQC